ncbi:MAG: phasin family protein [Methyloceanibacter sp.]|jgi:hypothetical protein
MRPNCGHGQSAGQILSLTVPAPKGDDPMKNRAKSPREKPRKADDDKQPKANGDKKQRKKTAVSEAKPTVSVRASAPSRELVEPAAVPAWTPSRKPVVEQASVPARTPSRKPVLAQVSVPARALARKPVLEQAAPAAQAVSAASELELAGAAESIEGSLKAARQSAIAVNRKLLDIAQANVHSSLDLAKGLAGAKTPIEIMRLQMHYWHERMGTLARQSEELRALSAELVGNAAEPIRAQMRRSLLARAA